MKESKTYEVDSNLLQEEVKIDEFEAPKKVIYTGVVRSRIHLPEGYPFDLESDKADLTDILD